MTAELIWRLVLAGILGAAIGLERELRAKEAGVRTHFMVSLGSCLIMIVSQWGFLTCGEATGIRLADPARIAAQIVSGIGFLGAGAIILQKHSVRGLTTAAGLWVAAGIGMAVGGALYVVGTVATLLALLGLELFHLSRNIRTGHTKLVFHARDRNSVVKAANALKDHGFRITSCQMSDELAEDASQYLRVHMGVRMHAGSDESQLLVIIHQLPDVTIEQIG